MTKHELSMLVRDHVSSDEPPFAGPDDVIARGRRRVRGRRFATGGVAALVAAVAAGGVLLTGPGDRSDGHEVTIDPATQQALEDYDARAMPELLDREARAVFSRHVDGLGPSEFEATDGNFESVPPEHYDKASGMSVAFGGDSEHQLRVDLGHARSEAEGDAQEYCADGLAEGYYLECSVDVVDDAVLISKLWALRPFDERDDGSMRALNTEQLAHTDPARLWFERDVKVIKSETFVTYTTERVKAPNQQVAEGLFQVPLADLAELATDPQLVIPHPPAGQNGCPAWMLHPEDTECVAAPDMEPLPDE
jgi:hypothetical protein